MPFDVKSYPYGNLQAYKMHIRPNIHQILYGDGHKKIPKNRHAENIISLIENLATNGVSTTWQIAKKEIRNDMEKLRTREKEYRRLLVGRNDKKRHNMGLLELGLVIQDGINHDRGPAAQYRLSLHGVLCCIDILDLDDDTIDQIAITYSNILPKVFGKWDFLKSILDKDIYKIKILSKGIVSDNLIPLQESDFPLSEIMSFIHIKYKQKFENIDEEDLAEQISFWFFTNLLYRSIKRIQGKTRNTKSLHTKLAEVLSKDQNLKKWYKGFLAEVKNYNKTQYFAIRKFKVI